MMKVVVRAENGDTRRFCIPFSWNNISICIDRTIDLMYCERNPNEDASMSRYRSQIAVEPSSREFVAFAASKSPRDFN